MATPHQFIEDIQKSQILPYVTNRWSQHVVQPLLNSILITAFLTAVVFIMQFILVDQPLVRIIPFLFFITVEGIYTHRWLYKPAQRMLDKWAYRGAELLLIYLMTRAYTWIVFGNRPVLANFLDYLKSPGVVLIDSYALFTFVMAIFAWVWALSLTDLFSDLAIDEGEAIYYLIPKKERADDYRPFQINRTALVQRFYIQWVWGGGLMLILTALSTIDLPSAVLGFTLNVSRLGLHPLLLTALIAYFIAGFLLVSQANLTVKKARWLREGAVVHPEVERSWYRHSLRLIGIVAFLTAFLPIGSTTPIGRFLAWLLSYLFLAFTAMIAFLWGLLALLFPQSQNSEAIPTPTPEPLPTISPLPTLPPQSTQPPSEVAQFIFSSAFWALAIVLSVIAISFYLRERGVKLNKTTAKITWQKIWKWLREGFGSLKAQAVELQKMLTISQKKSKETSQNGRATPFQFIRVNGLIPREQIKYFYLSTLRRAEEKGIARNKSETPAEFVETLKTHFPEAEEEVDTLTQAFLHARYSKKEIASDEVNSVKNKWKQMRANIRRKRK